MVTEIQIRPASEADEPFLAALFAEVHAAVLLPAALPPAMAQQLIDMQFRGQAISYSTQFPKGESSIVWLGEERIGRLFVNESATELRIVDIALSSRYRCRGFGTRLLKQMASRARKKAIPVRLSVRPGSPAVRLYERLGFIAMSATETHVEMEWNVLGRVSEAERTNPLFDDGVQAPDSPRLEATSAAFRSLIGLPLRAEVPGEGEVNLRVVAVRPLVTHQRGTLANDSFTVIFSGPIDAVLPAATYALSFGDHSALPVFLSALGRRADDMEYEAVFNRMTLH